MLSIHLCWNHLLRAFAAGILWKTQPWDIFARVSTAKCIGSCNHDEFLEDDYCFPFFKLKYLIPTLHHIFCLLKPWNIYGESNFVSSISLNKLENIHFCGLKKETFISSGTKIYVNSSQKYVKLFSSGYYFPSYISPLMISSASNNIVGSSSNWLQKKTSGWKIFIFH